MLHMGIRQVFKRDYTSLLGPIKYIQTEMYTMASQLHLIILQMCSCLSILQKKLDTMRSTQNALHTKIQSSLYHASPW